MATVNQVEVGGALYELKFEDCGSDMPGAPQKFKATAETVKHIQSLMQAKKIISVGSGGELTIE